MSFSISQNNRMRRMGIIHYGNDRPLCRVGRSRFFTLFHKEVTCWECKIKLRTAEGK